MTFWLIAAVIALATTAWLTRALLRNRPDDTPTAQFDLQVYRDQLKEVEKDRARGVISDEDAERVKVEVSRRILDADKALALGAEGGKAPKTANYAFGALAALVLIGGAFGLYNEIGAPGYPDLPLQARLDAADEARKERPSQAQAEAQRSAPEVQSNDPQHEELVNRLREVTKERPDELQGFVLLARNEAALGNFKPAYIAQRRVLELKGDQATANDYAMLADLLILAAGGYVSPEAEQALVATLNRDRSHGTALYYAGLMYAQTGRPDVAFSYWRPLLENSPPDAPWVAPIRAQIKEAAYYAGIDYTLPPAQNAGAGLPGPSAEDMEAAADMTPEERMEMIRGMVDRLGERLAEEGGTAEEWARLINAVAMLGEKERAAAIWGEARGVFAPYPDELAIVRAAATAAGVTE